MVSWNDPIKVPIKETPRATFTFINDNYGRDWKITAENVSEAWTTLAAVEETPREELAERGWRIKDFGDQ